MEHRNELVEQLRKQAKEASIDIRLLCEDVLSREALETIMVWIDDLLESSWFARSGDRTRSKVELPNRIAALMRKKHYPEIMSIRLMICPFARGSTGCFLPDEKGCEHAVFCSSAGKYYRPKDELYQLARIPLS